MTSPAQKYKQALKSKYSIFVFIDLLMMVLLIINLSLIIFDWLFVVPFINQFFEDHTPGFYAFYHDTIHENFFEIDLAFVSVFLAEFIFSWILAISQRIYHRWFFYPFIHWYDLIGCIPVGSFRFVRIFRIVSILVRLQNLKIIDLTHTYFYIKFRKYYGIFVEEISDRVVVNVLESVQDEISKGGPIVDNIIHEVIRPRQDILVQWVSERLQYAIKHEALNKKENIEEYVKNLISEGLSNNKELQTIEHIPLMGKMITETIESSISNIINNIIAKALADLASDKNKLLVNDTTNAILNTIEHKDELSSINTIFSQISVDIIELIKKEVKVKKWKIKNKAEHDIDQAEKDSVEFLMKDE